MINELVSFGDFECEPSLNNKDKQNFHLFFLRFMEFFKVKLELVFIRFENESNILTNKKKVVSGIVNSMQGELYSVAIRALIYEINEKRILNLLQGNTPEERYNYFNNLFINNEFFIETLEKYPVLVSLIDQMLQNRLDLISEAITRLSQDYKQITDEFNYNFKEIVEMQITSGDTHNKGKKVLSIYTDVARIIYKPHSLSTDSLYIKLIDFINTKNTLKHMIHYVNVIEKVDYGWQIYVESKTCSSGTEVSTYYYRLGVNLALLHIIGATDIHFENLISAGENPFIIDLETLIENKAFEMGLDGSLAQEFNRQINESVLGTAVLPLNLKNSLFDFDISAMSNFEEQTSDFWKMYVVLNNFTDEIKLERMPGTIGKASNFVMLDGKKVEPYEYLEDLMDGFEQCYQLISINKEAFIGFVSNYCTQNEVVVRQVLKPTSIYAKFLEASTHPNYLRSMKDRVILLNKLKLKKDMDSEIMQAQRYHEISALMDHDIPYFTTTMTSTDIQCNNLAVIPRFFNSTLLHIIKKRLDKISAEELELQLYYIRLSISTSVNNNWLKNASESFQRLNDKIPYIKKSDNYIDHAKEIGDLLEKKAIWNRDGTTCTWLVQLIDKERLKLGALNYLLYEGGGVLLFLFYLAKETNEEKYYNIAQAGLRGIEEQKNKIKSEPILSAFNGTGSLIYIYYTLYRMNKNSDAHGKYQSCLDELFGCNLEQDFEMDYVSGISGLITLLLNIYEVEGDKRLLDMCRAMGERFFDRLQNHEEIKMTGFSHGYSGLVVALVKLSVHLCERKFGSLAEELIARENEHYNQERHNWIDLREGEHEADPVFWCHGAPGIALSRALLLQYADELNLITLKTDIDKAIEKIMSNGFSEKLDHSLCHGIFGNIDILNSIGKIRYNKEILEIAQSEALIALERIKQKRVICGLNNAFDLVSFMVGLTGIGYSLLRLNNIKLPSILSLEIYH